MMSKRQLLLQQLAYLRLSGNLVLLLKALTLTGATLAFYFHDLTLVFTEALNNESASHILLIPVLLSYLIYRKRKMLKAVVATNDTTGRRGKRQIAVLSGFLLCATAVLLYSYGSYSFTPLEYHVLTLPIFVAGLTLALFNPRTLREAAFPIAFLVFLTPPPSEIIYGLGSTLSVVSSIGANALVGLTGIRSVLSNQFGTPSIVITRPDATTMTFTVDVACSGVYSLTSFLIFAAFMTYIVRDKTWKKATTFLLGFPLIFMLNIVRVTSIVWIGYGIGEEVALNVFHTLGGWVLIFVGTLILLVIVEKLLGAQLFTREPLPHNCPANGPGFFGKRESVCSTCRNLFKRVQSGLKKTDIVKVVITMLLVAFLVSIQVPIFASTNGPAQILVQTPTGSQGNIQMLPETYGYTRQFDFRDTEFEKMAKQDFSLLYAFKPDDFNRETIWVALEIAGMKSSLHPWEYCLITWPEINQYQPAVTQLDLRDVQISENPLIIARYFAFQYKSNNLTQVVLYWYETAIFSIDNSTQQKYVKTSLVAYPATPQDVKRIEEELLPIAVATVNYWEPLKTWGAVTMLLSKNGLDLALAPTICLVGIGVFEFSDRRRLVLANARAYQRLSNPNRQIIDAISKEQGTAPLTLPAVALACKDQTGQTMSEDELLRKLSEIEKTGLVTRRITSFNDEPIITWKTLIGRQHVAGSRIL